MGRGKSQTHLLNSWLALKCLGLFHEDRRCNQNEDVAMHRVWFAALSDWAIATIVAANAPKANKRSKCQPRIWQTFGANAAIAGT